MALKSLCTLALFLLSHTLLASAGTAGPAQCVTFDASWNLLAFNYNGKDLNVGALPASGTPKDITSTGRPPFDVPTSSPLCFLSQFTNSIYVLNADASDRSSVYIYDAAAASWSKQATSGAPSSYDPSVFGGILDHDTNVFYVMSSGTIYSLDMALLKKGTNTPIPWNEVQKPDLSGTGGAAGSGDGGSGGVPSYEPTLALAQNHIHFMGVPGLGAGEAKIFVIHYSYLQPEPQNYGQPAFPNQHGKVASFWKDSGVQTQFAFIPDDGSQTYVVDVTSNSTRSFPAPTAKDPYAQYATSTNALVQLASEGGAVSWMPYSTSGSSSSAWQALDVLPKASNTPASASSSGSATPSVGIGGSSNGTKTNGTKAGANGTAGGAESSAVGVRVAGGVWGMGVLALAMGLSAVVLGI